MDPLITNAIDPALLRVVERRGHDKERIAWRKRGSPPARANVREPLEETASEDAPEVEHPKHTLDDLA